MKALVITNRADIFVPFLHELEVLDTYDEVEVKTLEEMEVWVSSQLPAVFTDDERFPLVLAQRAAEVTMFPPCGGAENLEEYRRMAKWMVTFRIYPYRQVLI